MSSIGLWNDAVKYCRENGHVGACQKGTALYADAKRMYQKLKQGTDLVSKGATLVKKVQKGRGSCSCKRGRGK